MTYKEFIKIIPNETYNFIDELLPFLNYYDRKEININSLTIPAEAMDFILAVDVLFENPYYQNILTKCGFKNIKDIKKLILEKKSRRS